MSYIIDQSNSKDYMGRIEKLQTELERVQNAFEEYIATTEGLEVDVKRELHEMQKKKDQSTSANEELVKKLRNSEGLRRTLRLSSEGIREKLKSEMKLRREAEKALTESELELRSKTAKIKQLERIDSSVLRIVDSGIVTEMVNNTSKGFTQREFEAITDELMITQEKLQKAEENFRKSQRLVQDLERNFEKIGRETSENKSRDDKELLRELDAIRAEIDDDRDDIVLQSHSFELNKDQICQYELQLEESREEKLRLMQEISCLRNILCDHGDTEIIEGRKIPTTSESNSDTSIRKRTHEAKEGQNSEIESLRNQIEEVLNENMNLQEKLNKFEISSSLVTISTDEKSKLKDEIHRLKDELHVMHQKLENTSKEEHNKNKLQQNEKIEIDSGEQVEIFEDGIIGVKFATNVTPYAEDLVIGAKLRQSQRMLEESEQECSRMRAEILSLTESLYHAIRSRGVAIVSDEILHVENELEDKKRQIVALENNLMCTQKEVRLLSEEISHMGSALEEAQDKYNSIAEKLKETESALEAAKDTKFSQVTKIKRLESVAEKTPNKNAEISLLKTQFEKLNEKNEKLARRIKDAESEILFVREKQENVREDNNIRIRIAKESRERIYKVVSETRQRNFEVDELAFRMENRMRTTEENFGALQRKIALSMSNLRPNEQASSGERPKQIESMSQEDVSLMGSYPVKVGRILVDKDMEDEVNQYKPPLEYPRSLGENRDTSKYPKNLLSGRSDQECQLNEDNRTTISTSQKKSKYEAIVQRVANCQSPSTKEERELETRLGDLDVEDRE